MKIDLGGAVTVTLLFPNATLEAKLDALSAKIDQLLQKENQMLGTLDDVLAETKRGTTIETSLETLLKGLHDQVTAAQGDQVKIDQAFTAMKTRNDAAAAAIVANTINQPAPAPAPAP